MRKIGSFRSTRWGEVTVLAGNYGDANGPLALVLELSSGELLTRLTANMTRPDCSHDSRELPPLCFYVKTWFENERIAQEALLSGLFIERADLPRARCGEVEAPAWQVRMP